MKRRRGRPPIAASTRRLDVLVPAEDYAAAIADPDRASQRPRLERALRLARKFEDVIRIEAQEVEADGADAAWGWS